MPAAASGLCQGARCSPWHLPTPVPFFCGRCPWCRGQDSRPPPALSEPSSQQLTPSTPRLCGPAGFPLLTGDIEVEVCFLSVGAPCLRAPVLRDCSFPLTCLRTGEGSAPAGLRLAVTAPRQCVDLPVDLPEPWFPRPGQVHGASGFPASSSESSRLFQSPRLSPQTFRIRLHMSAGNRMEFSPDFVCICKSIWAERGIFLGPNLPVRNRGGSVLSPSAQRLCVGGSWALTPAVRLVNGGAVDRFQRSSPVGGGRHPPPRPSPALRFQSLVCLSS